jgi:hypothetical protein
MDEINITTTPLNDAIEKLKEIEGLIVLTDPSYDNVRNMECDD